MKQKQLKTILSASLIILAISFPSFAGSWQSQDGNWKYQNNDGSYVTSAWLSDGGASYYFGSDSIMLSNTLSPDSYILGRDGKRIFFSEMIPHYYWGNEAEFDIFFHAYMDYANGYSEQFNSTYDEIFKSVVAFDQNKDFESAHNSINRLDTFDFGPYMSSDNILIRKLAIADETFRIEQMYYLSETLKTIERKDYASYYEVLNKISISLDKQYNETSSSLNYLSIWSDAY